MQTTIGNVGGNDGHIEAFSTTCGRGGSTCSPEWVAPHLAIDNWVRPAVANGVVYVGGDRSNNVAFAVDCAARRWDLRTPLEHVGVASQRRPHRG